MTKKLTLEFVKKQFESKGFTLLSTRYENVHQKLSYLCPRKHKHSTSWVSWKNSSIRCPICSKKVRITINFIRDKFKSEGYILLTNFYISQKQKLNFICPYGHEYSISWNNWRAGKRCAICSKNAHFTLKQVKSSFQKEGYVLLSTTYKNAHTNLEYICPNGHQHLVTWNNWHHGDRCLECGLKNKKKKLKIIIKQKWKDPAYQKSIRKGRALKPNKPEKALNNLLQKLFPNEYKSVGDFQFFLGGKNPDFMNINGRKSLIELYGDYWHKNDDPQDRMNHFKQYGFDTLVVWENELKNEKLLITKLQNFHGNK